MKSQDHDNIIRVSFGWLLIGVIIMVGLGALGGILSAQVWPPNLTPLNQDNNQLISTVQQVTISPNKSASEVIEKAIRSVLIIKSNTEFLATAFVITNDGILVTRAGLPNSNLTSVDYLGRELPLEKVGDDALFGLTFLRQIGGITIPLDMRSDDLPVGWDNLLISLSKAGLKPRAELFHNSEYVLPTGLTTLGVQKLAHGSALSDDFLIGSPIVDDNSMVSGMLIDPKAGLVIPVSNLKESLQRISNGQREIDPFTKLGINLMYKFIKVDDNSNYRFVAEIIKIKPDSPAFNTGIRVNDIIIAINNIELEWNRSILNELMSKSVESMSILRGKETHNFIFQSE